MIILMMEKGAFKNKRATEEKKKKCDNHSDNEKEQWIKYEKKGKKVMCDNLDDEQRST